MFAVRRPGAVVSFNPRADAAQQLVRDRADRCRDLAHADLLVALRADDHDFIARRHLQPRYIDHRHIHAHAADDGYALSAYEHHGPAGHAPIEAVGVAGGDDRDGARPVAHGVQAVAGALARARALGVPDTAV